MRWQCREQGEKMMGVTFPQRWLSDFGDGVEVIESDDIAGAEGGDIGVLLEL